MSPEKLATSTTDGKPPDQGWEDGPTAGPVDPATGQHRAYYVLSEEERSKGFVRPVRTRYLHVGVRPRFPLRDLTAEEAERYQAQHYTAYEAYPATEALAGRYWTHAQLESGCGVITTMSRMISETYARDPAFYGATFCAGCREHFRVGERGDFEWLAEDGGGKVGT